MGLDFADGRTAVVAGVTAAVFSPRVRGVLRRGAVYGVAGALKAGDMVTSAARGAARGVRGEEASQDGGGPAAAAEPPPTTPAPRTRARRPQVT